MDSSKHPKEIQDQENANLVAIDTIRTTYLRPRTNFTPGKLKEYKRSYIRIDQYSKERLFKLVLKKGYKIYEAAQIVGIKYATAKTILFNLRREKKSSPKKETLNTSVKEQKINKLRIITTVSNEIISSNDYMIEAQYLSNSIKIEKVHGI